MEEIYLVKTDAGCNNNKFYRMVPQGDRFDVFYGRVGTNGQHANYSMSDWDKKYREKIRKGYTDQTQNHVNVVKVKKVGPTYKEIADREIANLVKMLQEYAAETVRQNYRVSANEVTPKMIQAAQEQIYRLYHYDNVYDFNSGLNELFMILPRRMSRVSDYVAKDSSEFGKIISREQDLLDVMAGQVKANPVERVESNEKGDPNKTILETLGIEIAPAEPKDYDCIKKHLGSSAFLLDCAWVVKTSKTQKNFDAFMRKHPDTESKLLWHGSRNANWWNILQTGLVLRPNAIITSKMFGKGIYFAPKARKSIGYTSLDGSCWAGGNSKTAYMALMEIAYGKPLHVYSYDYSKYHDFDYRRLRRAKRDALCLHAHAGANLRNDEIIVYREDQITIRYLVRLKK